MAKEPDAAERRDTEATLQWKLSWLVPRAGLGGSTRARAAKALAHQSSLCLSLSPKSTDSRHQAPDGGCGILLSAPPLLVSS